MHQHKHSGGSKYAQHYYHHNVVPTPKVSKPVVGQRNAPRRTFRSIWKGWTSCPATVRILLWIDKQAVKKSSAGRAANHQTEIRHAAEAKRYLRKDIKKRLNYHLPPVPFLAHTASKYLDHRLASIAIWRPTKRKPYREDCQNLVSSDCWW